MPVDESGGRDGAAVPDPSRDDGADLPASRGPFTALWRWEVALVAFSVILLTAALALDVDAYRSLRGSRHVAQAIRPCRQGMTLEPGEGCAMILELPAPVHQRSGDLGHSL